MGSLKPDGKKKAELNVKVIKNCNTMQRLIVVNTSLSGELLQEVRANALGIVGLCDKLLMDGKYDAD